MSSTQHAHDEHKTVCVYLLPSPKHARVDHFKPGWVSKVIVNSIVSDTFIGFALMQVLLPHYSGQGAKSNEAMDRSFTVPERFQLRKPFGSPKLTVRLGID